MNDCAAMAERHALLLGELAGLGMAVARDLQGRVACAETDEAAQGLALAFQRVSRSVRQTLALEAKLARDMRRIAREDAADTRDEVRRRVNLRQGQVRVAVAREVWAEHEGDEAEARLEALESHILDAALSETFLDEPIEACIARIRVDLGLAANDTGAADRPADALGAGISGADLPGAADRRSSA